MESQDADKKEEPEKLAQSPQTEYAGMSPRAERHKPEDDFAAASRAVTDYSQFTPQLRPRKKWPRVLGWAILTILIIAALTVGVYWFASKQAPTNQKQTSSQQNNNASNGAQKQNNSTATTTKRYDSTNFHLSFKYPENWTVTDTGNGKLTVVSPAMQLTDATGQSQTGKVVMSIQNKDSADFSMFKQGSAIAVLGSQKIAYTNPTSTQRANTYLSFLQYEATVTHGALDGVYITGDYGYKKDQYIPEVDIRKVDPQIRVTFLGCKDTKCTKTTSLSISSNMWSNTNFSTPIENMLKSLAIQ